MLFWWEDPNTHSVIDANYSLVPPSLGTLVELPDHKAKFTAASFAGTGEIRGTNPNWTLDPYDVRVVRDFDIHDRQMYRDFESELEQTNRSMRNLVTPLYYAHPSGQYTFTLSGQSIRFNVDQSTETDANGRFGMFLVRRDQIFMPTWTYDFDDLRRVVDRNGLQIIILFSLAC
jgi:hypothetical protein